MLTKGGIDAKKRFLLCDFATEENNDLSTVQTWVVHWRLFISIKVLYTSNRQTVKNSKSNVFEFGAIYCNKKMIMRVFEGADY